ncbi:translocation protein SEC62-like [Strongylocentrotus purpuratus]|uniref:Translocation protein SEC62 n=1 Tax=Strongylocentrotus purpuratus TaxID=7668 RepID=A0A7M7ND84_STRPU|nr:translocation protein SEC62-like [Strongylocentrotus purpuratus]
MAERQSRRRKKRDDGQARNQPMRNCRRQTSSLHLATKTSNFMGHKVEYFTGSKAVDLMLDSKWASGKGSTEILFTDRRQWCSTWKSYCRKEEGTPKAKKSKEVKRKIKLEPTEDQVFRDGNDAYVWIYDPLSQCTTSMAAVGSSILFVLLWSGTMGRIHLWIFQIFWPMSDPRIFQPAYEYTVNKRSAESTDDKPLKEGWRGTGEGG